MSTLVVSNINDGTTTVPATYVTNGSAKAWVNLNGTGTIAIRDSHNISSATDNTTGDYTFNVSNSFADANYNGSGMGCGPTDPYRIVNFRGSVAPTSSAFRVATYNTSGGGLEDALIVGVTTHGDLA